MSEPARSSERRRCCARNCNLFGWPAESIPVEQVAINNDEDLASAVEKLHNLALSNNEAVRAAFDFFEEFSVSAEVVVLAVVCQRNRFGAADRALHKMSLSRSQFCFAPVKLTVP